MATNIQFNKDDTVRLIRFSKPLVTDETLQHLKGFPKIDYLAVVCPLVTDVGIENVAGLTNLDTLLLSKTAVTDAGLTALKDLSKLERLYLADTAVTDAGLKHLAGLETLKTLSLERTQITDAGLQQLSGLKNLETLLLSGTNITDDGLAHLASLEQLRHLYLPHCKIRGPGLLHLKPLEKLEHLSLSSNAIGNDAVEFIAAVSTLKHVELYQTGFTREGIVKLREALPKTGVYVSPELTTASKTNTDDGATVGTTKATETRPNEDAVRVPIEQRLADSTFVPNFQRHVIPLLGRLGCNGRSCHGSFQGQGEFRLSMFGYDFDTDHKNLLERVDLKQTEGSLILNKPTSEDEHGGGLRFSPGIGSRICCDAGSKRELRAWAKKRHISCGST